MNRDSSTGKRRWPAVLFFCAAAVLLVFLSLPYIVEHIILPPLLARSGYSDYQVTVSRFGPAGASFQVATESADPLLTSGTVRIKWTVPGLLQHRLDQVVLNGFLVNLSFPLTRVQPAASDSTRSVSLDLPVIIEDIRVVNSTVLLHLDGRVLPLPVSLAAKLQEKPEQSGRTSFRYRVELTVSHQQLTAELGLEPALETLTGSLQANLDLDAIDDFLPQTLPVTTVGGTVNLSGEFVLAAAPFSIENLKVALDFENLEVEGSGLSLQNVDNAKPRIVLAGAGAWYELKGTGFALIRPVQAALELETSLNLRDGTLDWQGSLTARPNPAQQLGGQWVLESAPELQLQYSGRGNRAIKVALQSTSEAGMDSPPFVLRNGNKALRLSVLTAEARPVEDAFEPDGGTGIGYSILGSDLQVNAEDVALRIPEIALQGRAALPPVPDPSEWPITGILHLGDGSLDLPKQAMRLEGIQLFLPLHWPGQDKPDAGDFRIGSFVHQQARLGTFAGELTQSGPGLSLQGKLLTTLLPEAPVRLTGTLQAGLQGLPRVELTYAMQNGRLGMENIAALYPKLSAVSGSAELNMEGSVRFDSCGLDGEMSARLSQGNFAMPDAHFALENVRLDVHVPHLQEFATDPAQEISIGSLRSNQVAVSDIQALFRLESPQSLLIERLSGKWAGGRIFSSSFRLHKDLQKLELALFCDRLELAQILSQFKLADAGGQGRLSGRVPLFYEDGKFFVDDGFLFTSPGEQGTLKIKKSEYLAVGVPTDVPQFSPLHFAGAALRDFEYNWAKLNIYSEEENLLLKLQIDGRPGERLPYRFDPASNAFVRLKDNVSMGMDQPVKLDVNFKVPVNELFKYQKGIMPLLRNLK